MNSLFQQIPIKTKLSNIIFSIGLYKIFFCVLFLAEPSYIIICILRLKINTVTITILLTFESFLGSLLEKIITWMKYEDCYEHYYFILYRCLEQRRRVKNRTFIGTIC